MRERNGAMREKNFSQTFFFFKGKIYGRDSRFALLNMKSYMM